MYRKYYQVTFNCAVSFSMQLQLLAHRNVTLNMCKSHSKTYAYVMREQIHMDCAHRDGN